MITQKVGSFAYTLSIQRGSAEPRFLVLGKQPGPQAMRALLCSGRVAIDPKLRVVVEQGVLPMWIESAILRDARRGIIEGPAAALRRWLERVSKLNGGER